MVAIERIEFAPLRLAMPRAPELWLEIPVNLPADVVEQLRHLACVIGKDASRKPLVERRNRQIALILGNRVPGGRQQVTHALHVGLQPGQVMLCDIAADFDVLQSAHLEVADHIDVAEIDPFGHKLAFEPGGELLDACMQARRVRAEDRLSAHLPQMEKEGFVRRSCVAWRLLKTERYRPPAEAARLGKEVGEQNQEQLPVLAAREPQVGQLDTIGLLENGPIDHSVDHLPRAVEDNSFTLGVVHFSSPGTIGDQSAAPLSCLALPAMKTQRSFALHYKVLDLPAHEGEQRRARCAT